MGVGINKKPVNKTFNVRLINISFIYNISKIISKNKKSSNQYLFSALCDGFHEDARKGSKAKKIATHRRYC